MSLKQILTDAEVVHAQAEAAVAFALDVAEDVPATAAEFLAQTEIPALLRVEATVDAYVLGKVALDFDRFIRRDLSQRLAHNIGEKLKIEHQRIESEPFGYPGLPVHVYRGEVFVFTREELKELVDDAMRAGRLSSQ